MKRPTPFEACKIFTVDDSSIIVSRIKQMLGEISSVDFLGNAESIRDAFSILEEKNPDVMILDIHLGQQYEMNGVDLLSLVRRIYPEVKIIMFTNLSDERYRNLCMEFGADYFFDKSNDFDKIPEALDVIIRRKI